MNNGTSASSNAVLTSWKDIARYMGKGVRTVQRWEQDFGLPVRRPLGSNKRAVLARPVDLDAWVALRCSSRSHPPAPLAVPIRADHPPAVEGRRQHMENLCALIGQIETNRMLRENHHALVHEVNTALETLRKQLQSLHRDH